MKLGVFMERDGVLNRARIERQHQVSPLTVEDFKVSVEAGPLLKRLKAAGLVLIATTNQPGLSRGYQSRRELDRMHAMLRAALPLDDILVCPHDETDRCPCRKPKAGLLLEAAFQWSLDLDRSFVISDKWQDAAAARAAGCTSLLIESPWVGNGHRDFLLPDLAAAVEKVLQLKAAATRPAPASGSR
jgi:D-glycero-D-manno-heptose 1,7-bisphosphate phosphatase